MKSVGDCEAQSYKRSSVNLVWRHSLNADYPPHEEETARMLAAVVFEVSGKLDKAVADIQAAEPTDVFQRERTAIGRVMGAMHVEILEPVFGEHPDIAPDWWNDAGTGA